MLGTAVCHNDLRCICYGFPKHLFGVRTRREHDILEIEYCSVASTFMNGQAPIDGLDEKYRDLAQFNKLVPLIRTSGPYIWLVAHHGLSC